MLKLLEHPGRIFALLSALLLGCIFGALITGEFVFALVPLAVAIGVISIMDISKLYFLLILVIPITIEIYLPNGLGIDLPGEIILIAITALSPFLFLLKFKKSGFAYLQHPITIVLLFHLVWILIAGVLAEDLVVGVKFFLAKLWYVIPFFFVSIYVLRDKLNYRIFFWTLLIPLVLSIIYVLIRHASVGFAFSEVNYSVSPIYRNHVNYGLLMVAFLPYVWAFYHWYKRGTVERLILIGVGLLMLVAIYFTYTRAAQGAVLLGIFCYFVIKFRWTVPVLLLSSIAIVMIGFFFVNESHYLDFAPDYERTITHTNYDNLIEATVKLEDISTMERVNRWVAGGHMIKERPWTGFGPGNFYFNYRNYMVSSFETYVSDNPDKSGIHNYYLMTMVEQGVIGLLVFLVLLFVTLFYGTRSYHLILDPHLKTLVMAATISIILISITILINDLLGALKIGGLFFIGMAVIVRESVRALKEKTTSSF